jgi:hypothetical protein
MAEIKRNTPSAGFMTNLAQKLNYPDICLQRLRKSTITGLWVEI